jgi:hypothetical protein
MLFSLSPVYECSLAMFEEKENAGSLYRRLNARLQSAIIVCMFHLPILSKPGW